MCIALLMHIAHGANKLFEDVLAGVFWKPLVGHFFDVMEDAHPLAKLHD